MAVLQLPLGAVTVPAAGTPVAVSSVIPATLPVPHCHAYIIQTLPTNTGRVYIGKSNMVKATYVGVMATLPVPTVNLTPTLSVAIAYAANGLNLADLYIDADVNGEGVLVTALVA